jgi:uncharacterized membrane protein
MTAPAVNPPPNARADDLRLVVARVLTVGIALSAALILAGFVASLIVGWDGSLLGAGTGGDPSDVGALAEGLRSLRPQAIAQLGLLTLILTPMSRVAASLVLFAVEHDRTYVVISAIVLAILLTGLLVIR